MADPDPFDRSHAPPIGRPEALAPGLRVVTAPNPGPMTFTGTRSYILGAGRVAIIDPGPAEPRHVEALAAALEPGRRWRRSWSPTPIAITPPVPPRWGGGSGRRCWRMAIRSGPGAR